MAVARHPVGVIVFSWTAGIMYATLFTMPYLLVARYHAAETVSPIIYGYILLQSDFIQYNSQIEQNCAVLTV